MEQSFQRSNERWRKSSRSALSNDCVEMCERADGVAVRDSKDPDGAVLMFATPGWRSFLLAVRDERLAEPSA